MVAVWKAHIFILRQETLNYWKQLPHVLKYFRAEEDPTVKLPQNFMTGFLEVYTPCSRCMGLKTLAKAIRDGIDILAFLGALYFCT